MVEAVAFDSVCVLTTLKAQSFAHQIEIVALMETSVVWVHGLLPKYQNTFSPPTCNGERTSMLDGLHYLPKLRHLYWDAQHLKSLPSWFCASFLLELTCLAARQKQFGKEVSKTLGNLRSLDLTSCKHLTEFLNLLKAD